MTFRPRRDFFNSRGHEIGQRVLRQTFQVEAHLVAVEPEDEGGLLVPVVDLARQVEHAADVDEDLAVAQDPRHWHCNQEKRFHHQGNNTGCLGHSFAGQESCKRLFPLGVPRAEWQLCMATLGNV